MIKSLPINQLIVMLKLHYMRTILNLTWKMSTLFGKIVYKELEIFNRTICYIFIFCAQQSGHI